MSGHAAEKDVGALVREAYRLGYEDRAKQRDYDPGHALDLLRAQIDGALAEAWDEGLSVGSVAGYYGPRNPRNPYRAAHLSDTERAGDAE